MKFVISNVNKKVSFKKLSLFVYSIFLLDFLYIKEIPLINAILTKGSYYKDLEHIPMIYPLVSSISVFLIVFYFYQYISFKNKRYLSNVFILLVPIILNVGRGIVVMALIPCLLIYLSELDFKKSYKKIAKLFLILFSLSYLFGLLGDVRISEKLKNKDKNNNDIILQAGEATSEFRESIFPGEMFWVYLYITSPISNFDNAVTYNKKIGLSSLNEFIVYNFLPQSLQKKFLGKFEKNTNYLVVDTFNVSTMYLLPYFQFGWLGVFFFLIIYFVIFFLCFHIVRRGNYKVVFLALFSNSFIIGWFSNALVLDVIFIPILICVILSFK
ncbi:MAG: O-antigen polymerase [Polaribacter sp.]